jgi:copper chaperone CopZ
MTKVMLEVPSMYADHHVSEVRQILLGLPGVKEVYASSAFHAVEVSFDAKITTADAIRAALEPTGYLNDLPVTAEPGIAMTEAGGGRFTRHTASYPQTQQAVAFTQQVIQPDGSGWACPGFGLLTMDGEE